MEKFVNEFSERLRMSSVGKSEPSAVSSFKEIVPSLL